MTSSVCNVVLFLLRPSAYVVVVVVAVLMRVSVVLPLGTDADRAGVLFENSHAIISGSDMVVFILIVSLIVGRAGGQTCPSIRLVCALMLFPRGVSNRSLAPKHMECRHL